MLRLICTFVIFLSCPNIIFSQPPPTYYASITTQTGANLKTSLFHIIKGHTVQTYASIWTHFQSTDARPNGKVWEMYVNCDFNFGAFPSGNQDVGTLGGTPCQVFNREHSMPKSWFGNVTPSTSSPPSTDLFHIFPADKNANSTRNDFPYGEVGNPTKSFASGAKLGTCSFPGYSGTVFEPADEYKGDLARNYFYMATRYETSIAGWQNFNANGNTVLNGTSFPCFETWHVNLLAKWHMQDTVDAKERNRNNAIYTIQGNRNPYIDHPEWAAVVWGFATVPGGQITSKPMIENAMGGTLEVYPNPTEGTAIIKWLGTPNVPSVPFQIVDGLGNIVRSGTMYVGESELDMLNVPTGVYILSIRSSAYTIQKLVVKL